jgi:hypothetical protein
VEGADIVLFAVDVEAGLMRKKRIYSPPIQGAGWYEDAGFKTEEERICISAQGN